MLILSGILSGAVIFLFASYFLLAVYYKNGFSYNTWINGVYCTGKSVESVNEELRTKFETRSIEITNPDGTVEYILPDEINYRIDFTDYLNEILDKQNPYLWITNLKSNWKQNISAKPNFSYDEYALNDKINNLSFVKNNAKNPKSVVEIRKDNEGFYLYDNHSAEVDINKVYETINTALYTEEPVSFNEEYLIQPTYNESEKKILKEWDSLNEFLTPKLTYDMGAEQIIIDSTILSSFIETDTFGNIIKDENNIPVLNEQKMVEFIDNLCSQYDTYNKDRIFTTSKGETKVISNVYYGTLLNHDKEIKYFNEAVKNGITETHIPEYIRTGYVRGLDDIGLTYIEVDMGEQVLYYYEDGILSLKTDIVSGKPSTPTPQMICSIYYKKEKAILRGPGYASPVDYWMAVYQGIGLHDSSWQRQYGGDWYLSHGSHGCINMKINAVSYVYETAEVGTPVILYY